MELLLSTDCILSTGGCVHVVDLNKSGDLGPGSMEGKRSAGDDDRFGTET